MTFARVPLFMALTVAAQLACSASPFAPIQPKKVAANTQTDHDAKATWLLRETHVRFVDEGEPVALVRYHRRLLVRHHSARKYARCAFSYSAPFSEVVSLRGRTVKPDGTEKLFGVDDAVDFPARSGYTLYSSARIKMLLLSDIPKGSVVECVAVMRKRLPRVFHEVMSFGSQFPIERARLIVDAPAGWDIKAIARQHGIALPWPAKHSTSAEGERWVWQRKKIAAWRAEKRALRAVRPVPVVELQLLKWTHQGASQQAFEGPKQVSTWIHELSLQARRAAKDEAAIVERVLADSPEDQRIRAAKLYGWVRDHVRYCSIQVGYGAWRPANPVDVLSLRYGDCKGKANLLRSLLHRAGIASRLVLIYSHRGDPLRYGLSTVTGNFNHMILVVDLPSGPVYVDPTSRVAPFDRLPFNDQGAQVLPAQAAGSELVQLPTDPPARHVRQTLAELSISPAGDVTGRVTLDVRGFHADSLRSALLHSPKSRWKKVMNRRVSLVDIKWPRGVKPTGETPPLFDAAMQASGEVQRAEVLLGHGQLRMLRPVDLLRSTATKLPTTKRRGPILLGAPNTTRTRLKLRLSAGMAWQQLPSPVTIERGFARYRLTWRHAAKGEEGIVLEREVIWRKRIVAAKDAGVYREWVRDVRRAEGRGALLEVLATKTVGGAR